MAVDGGADEVFDGAVCVSCKHSEHPGLLHITSAPCSRVGGLESEVGEGWFLVAVVVAAVVRVVFRFCHVGRFVAAGRVYFADEGFDGSGSFVKCDVPDAALPFAPTFGSDILLNIVVGVPGFSDNSARHRVVVEAGGGVGACLRVAGEPVAGGIPVEPSRAASGLVDGLHDALFNAWCDRERVGGVFVGEVAHGVVLFSGSRCVFAYSHCSTRVGCVSTVFACSCCAATARSHIMVSGGRRVADRWKGSSSNVEYYPDHCRPEDYP